MADFNRVALVVSHPAHAAMVAGLVQRFRPQLLVVGQSLIQRTIVSHGLSLMGLENRVTFLDIPDAESYERVLVGDYSLHISLGREILRWLQEIRPTDVFGDAFELSNFQHDLTRLLLDRALAKLLGRGGSAPKIRNFEIPICCRTADGTDALMFQTFPDGEYEELYLTNSEAAVKQAIMEWASQQDAFVAKVCKLIPDFRRELYRPVPQNRDYTVPPPGLRKHYDDRGKEETRAGRYKYPILFDQHFVPMVDAITSAEGLDR